MSNVNPTGPRTKIQENQAASIPQGDAIQAFLNKQFKSDPALANRIYNNAMDSIPPRDKIGKNLSFDTVKKAILEAAEKEHKSIDSEELEKLRSLFPEEKKTEDDPYKFIKDAKDTIETSKKKLTALKEKFEASMADVDLQEIAKKAEEAKEQLMKKVEETKDQVIKKIRDPNKNV